MLAGALLFIAGFAAVFITASVLAAQVGRTAAHATSAALQVVVGVLIIVLGLAFLGLIPGLQHEWRIHRLPAAGLLGAPVFGAVFALSWVPCLRPTLGAVLGLAGVGGDTGRAVVLAVGVLPRARPPVPGLRAWASAGSPACSGDPAQQPLGHPGRRRAADPGRAGPGHRRLGRLRDLAAGHRRRRRGERLLHGRRRHRAASLRAPRRRTRLLALRATPGGS